MKDKIIEILYKHSISSKAPDCTGKEVEYNEVTQDDFYRVAKDIEELYCIEHTVDISTRLDSANGVKKLKRFKKRIIIEDE